MTDYSSYVDKLVELMVGGFAKKFKEDGANISIDSFLHDDVHCYPDMYMLRKGLFSWFATVGKDVRDEEDNGGMVINSIDCKQKYLGYLDYYMMWGLAERMRAGIIEVVDTYRSMWKSNGEFVDNGELDSYIPEDLPEEKRVARRQPSPEDMMHSLYD